MISWAKVDKGIEVIRTLVPKIRAWRQKRREEKTGTKRPAFHDPAAEALLHEKAEANRQYEGKP